MTDKDMQFPILQVVMDVVTMAVVSSCISVVVIQSTVGHHPLLRNTHHLERSRFWNHERTWRAVVGTTERDDAEDDDDYDDDGFDDVDDDDGYDDDALDDDDNVGVDDDRIGNDHLRLEMSRRGRDDEQTPTSKILYVGTMMGTPILTTTVWCNK